MLADADSELTLVVEKVDVVVVTVVTELTPSEALTEAGMPEEVAYVELAVE